MTHIENQERWVFENHVTPGDRVKIRFGQQGGLSSWALWIGAHGLKEGDILTVTETNGFGIGVEGLATSIPYHILEKIDDIPKPFDIELFRQELKDLRAANFNMRLCAASSFSDAKTHERHANEALDRLEAELERINAEIEKAKSQ